MRVKKEQVRKMKELRSEGLSYLKISKIVKVSSSTVQYHLNEDYKKKTKIKSLKNYIRLSKEKKKEISKKKKDYMRNYMRERYNSDPEFRKKVIMNASNSRARRLRS